MNELPLWVWFFGFPTLLISIVWFGMVLKDMATDHCREEEFDDQ